MGAETPGELTGQISINELLIALGEDPVEPLVVNSPMETALSYSDGQAILHGL